MIYMNVRFLKCQINACGQVLALKYDVDVLDNVAHAVGGRFGQCSLYSGKVSRLVALTNNRTEAMFFRNDFRNIVSQG